MHNPALTKTFVAETDVPPFRLIEAGTADDKVALANAPTDRLLGVSDGGLGSRETGKPVDIHLTGVANVEYGATVARGDLLTSDANGRAVPVNASVARTTPPVRVAGVAQESGPAGMIGSLLLAPSIL